jgi:Virulence activator alpha C-term
MGDSPGDCAGGPPQKKLYTLTEAGHSALREWATQPPGPPVARSELLLKTYAIWLADPHKALDLFRAQERSHREQLALYEQIQARIEQETGGGPRPDEPLFGDDATVRLGVAYEQAYVVWCRWVVEQLETFIEDRRQAGQ